jgi:hypothetical protein
VAAQGDAEEDAIIGRNFTIGDGAQEIGNLVLPSDVSCESANSTCIERLDKFRSIVAVMKDGGTGYDAFTRRAPDQGGTETVHIAYAPVKTMNIRPLDSSQFARGVEVSENLVYSLALCETEEGLLAPFTPIEKEMRKQINWAVDKT